MQKRQVLNMVSGLTPGAGTIVDAVPWIVGVSLQTQSRSKYGGQGVVARFNSG
jgi:hypothetical protein